MRRPVLVVILALMLAPVGPAANGPSGLEVRVDRAAISTALGHKFAFRSTIVNNAPRPATNLIAHLNVLSLRTGVYIDPEDWSSNRTRYLPPLPAGGSLPLTWTLQAVNSGAIAIYVAVLPQSGAPVPPVTGPTIRVAIAERQTLNSGGILPLVLGIPALLASLAVWIRVRRRSRRLG